MQFVLDVAAIFGSEFGLKKWATEIHTICISLLESRFIIKCEH